ncbi:MAG: rhodanese-like domain-containing protein [Steroidobacteraceae bacterium]
MNKTVTVLMLALTTTAFAQQGNAVKAADAAKAPVAKEAVAQEKKATSQAHILSNAEFDKLQADPTKIVIIDVRRPDELTSIGGFAVYLSIQQADLEKSLKWIPKDRAIITVSNHAGRAGKAADLLASKGFKVAGAIGVQTYEEAGGKLTKIAPKEATAAATTAAVVAEKK